METKAEVRTVWIVDGGYLIKSIPERVDYCRLKEELERLNGGEIFESIPWRTRPPRARSTS